MTPTRILIAIAMGYVIWRSAIYFIRMFQYIPDEIKPEDIIEAEQTYKCTECGAEMIMTYRNEIGEHSGPRHCREPMVEVWRT